MAVTDADPWILPLTEGLERLPGPNGERFATLLAHGTMTAEVYAPRGRDPQQPHAQDEIYVVLTGTGTFLRGEERRPFGPGDLIFVPAGMVHRFEDFTDDLTVWVIFWGPDGGEA